MQKSDEHTNHNKKSVRKDSIENSSKNHQKINRKNHQKRNQKRNQKSIDMLNGSLTDKILIFAIPIALAQILEQMFNAADLVVVGRFVGKNAMAAVGANSPVVGLLVTLFFGISVGSNVAIAKKIGQKDDKGMCEAISTSLILAVMCGVTVALLGESFAPDVLGLMSVPKEVFFDAVLYLRIYLAGMPFILLYNFEAAIFRAKGDTRTPMLCLVLAGIINVILNIFFVKVLGMRVNGVALATGISNAVSSVLLLVRLLSDTELKLTSYIRQGINKSSLYNIFSIGLPAGLQGVVFSISNICIQSAINSLGADVMAASSAAFNVEIFAYYVVSCFGQACTTFTGQNYGAGNRERCRKVMRVCLLLDEIGTILIAGFILLTGKYILMLFNTDSAVVNLGYQRLLFILIPGVFNVVIEVVSGAMRGYGRSMTPALIALFGICGVRIIWAYTFFQKYHTFGALLSAYPTAWVVTATAMLTAYILSERK